MVRTPQAAIIAIISTNAGTASLAAREAVSRETCGTRRPLLWSVCTDWGLGLGLGLGLEGARRLSGRSKVPRQRCRMLRCAQECNAERSDGLPHRGRIAGIVARIPKDRCASRPYEEPFAQIGLGLGLGLGLELVSE